MSAYISVLLLLFCSGSLTIDREAPPNFDENLLIGEWEYSYSFPQSFPNQTTLVAKITYTKERTFKETIKETSTKAPKGEITEKEGRWKITGSTIHFVYPNPEANGPREESIRIESISIIEIDDSSYTFHSHISHKGTITAKKQNR